MRVAVGLTIMFVLGCGGSVEPEPPPCADAPTDAPLTCGPITGRYALRWTRRNGTCVMVDRVTEAPGFDCGAEPLSNVAVGDRCELGGDIACANGTTTLVCSTRDYETIVCDAFVTQESCSGEYTLVMVRVE